LGLAQNVGDAFRFLVLTEPESDESSDLPQVLARSVIRRRFLRSTDASPAEQESGESTHLTNSLSNKSPVFDPHPSDSEECDGDLHYSSCTMTRSMSVGQE
jgi:hypothetical protein